MVDAGAPADTPAFPKISGVKRKAPATEGEGSKPKVRQGKTCHQYISQSCFTQHFSTCARPVLHLHKLKERLRTIGIASRSCSLTSAISEAQSPCVAKDDSTKHTSFDNPLQSTNSCNRGTPYATHAASAAHRATHLQLAVHPLHPARFHQRSIRGLVLHA